MKYWSVKVNLSRKESYSYRIKTSDVPSSNDADFKATQMAAGRVAASLALFDSGQKQDELVIGLIADRCCEVEFVDTSDKSTMFDTRNEVNPVKSIRREQVAVARAARQLSKQEMNAARFEKVFSNPVISS